jgi:hypothetical protein
LIDVLKNRFVRAIPYQTNIRLLEQPAAFGFLRNPTWDFTWLLCGLWLLPLVILLDWGEGLETFFLLCTLLFWLTHRFSSLLLAFTSPSYSSVRQAQPLRFLGVPILVILSVFTWLYSPWPTWTLVEKILVLAVIDYAWALYHFAIQHYGVLRLYQLRNPRQQGLSSSQQRNWCLLLGGVLPWLGELVQGTTWLQQEGLLTFSWVPSDSASIWLLRGMVCLVSLMAWRKLTAQNCSLPYQAYLLSLLLLANAAWWISPLAFLVLISVQHWLVAVGIAGHARSIDSPKDHSGWRIVGVWVLMTILAVPFLEMDSIDFSNGLGAEWIPGWQALLGEPSVLTFCLGLAFASGFVHYLMDRAVYRFADPMVRRQALRLYLSDLRTGRNS